jgi:hypothetical protein
LRNAHVILMPDTWEYPWYASWDLAFHCVAMAHIDPEFAKAQLLLMGDASYQNVSGQFPAYEWNFDDVNPPVHAWAAIFNYRLNRASLGNQALPFLKKTFQMLVTNFTWWLNRKDRSGKNTFEGGFLGLDNIGPLDRSHLPAGSSLQQADATGWMASYALSMGVIALVLERSGRRPAADLVLKFIEHFAAIRQAIADQELWDDADGLFYDRLMTPDGNAVPVKVRSMVGSLKLVGEGRWTRSNLGPSDVGDATLSSAARPGDRGGGTGAGSRGHRMCTQLSSAGLVTSTDPPISTTRR